LHRCDDNQDAPFVRLANLSRALLAIANIGLQIEGPIQNDLFSLFRLNLMARQMSDIRSIPIETALLQGLSNNR